MRFNYLFLLAILISLNIFSQTDGTYTSTVVDDYGSPIVGVIVQVRGTGFSTITDSMGEFTIKAKTGDVLIFSKNGKRINTLTLNSSYFYKIEDKSGEFETRFESKQKNSKRRNQKEVLLDSARYYIDSKPDESVSFVEKAFIEMGNKGKQDEKSEAYSILGQVYFNLKQYDLAVTNFEMALNFKNSNILKLSLAEVYALNGNYEESTDLYNELLLEDIKTNEKITVYEGLGDNAGRNFESIDTAIDNYKKGLSLAQQYFNNPKITILNAKLSEKYSQKGKTQIAENYVQNTLKSSENIDVKSRALSTNTIADQYKAKEEFDKEIELRKQTLEEIENFESEEEEDFKKESLSSISPQKINLDIANAYVNKGDLLEAVPYLEKSILVADSVEDLETQKDALQRLSELYELGGKSEKALEKYREYALIVDRIYQQKEQEIKKAVALGKELTNKQNRINSLEKDRELSESRYKFSSAQDRLTKETYKRQQLIIYSLIGGLLLLLFSLFWMYKSNKQRRLANNLLALKSLRSQMNPHFIFNALNSVNSFVAQNNERETNRYLTDFSKLMRSVLDNSERDFISLEKEIELLTLYIKLEHLRFKDKFDYTINIDDNLTVSEFKIPPMLIQPYVENAVWHGLRYKKDKGLLVIEIMQKDDKTVEISIEDNGIGRTNSKKLKTVNQQMQKSRGMNNIEKRIAILNEMYSNKVNVNIDDVSPNGEGTRVVLTLNKD